MAAKSMLLMIAAIGILVIPGVFVNNLTTSGMTLPDPNLTCNGYPDLTCHGSVPVGCQAQPTQCNLQNATAFSFLNQASPFTFFFTGNLFGLFSFITAGSNSFNSGPWESVGLPPNLAVPVNCYVANRGNIHVGHLNAADVLPTGCTQTNQVGQNLTKADTIEWPTAPNQGNGSRVHLYNLVVSNSSDYSITDNQKYMCIPTVDVNPTPASAINDAGFNFWGCQYYQTINGTGFLSTSGSTGNHTNYWYFLLENNNTAVTEKAENFTGHMFFQANPVGWTSFGINTIYDTPGGVVPFHRTDTPTGLTLPLGYPPINAGITNFITSAENSDNNGGSIGQNTGTSFWGLNLLIAWVIGIVLFIIGLGISFQASGEIFASGASVGAGVNSQGTRLAQVLGLGLIVWVPLYSEFSAWITPGNLPNGANLWVNFLIIGMFFFGLLWRIWSLD
jgi:hypothetical protein